MVFRRVRYNFYHNHPVQHTNNIREMRLSKEMTKKISHLIERGKTIQEIQDELCVFKSEFDDIGTQLRRDDFVTYDDVRHQYAKLIKTKFQKHKSEVRSCELWMEYLKEKGYFVYEDDQCYGFSSPWQLEQLRLFGEVFCFDGTHEVGG